MEAEYRAYEAATFSNVAETEKQDQLFNNTLPDANIAIPAYSSMLFNNKPSFEDQTIGPALSLQVDRGDVVDLASYAKFVSYTGDGSKVAGNTLIGAIASAFTPIGATAEVAQNIIDQFANAGVGALSPAAETDAPAAFLNYLLFDKNLALIKTGFKAVSSNADGAFEHLVIPTVNIKEAGYIYIYVSNEDAADVNVYFDDLKITHTKSKIVQMDDYYPFGLAFNSFKREDNLTNKFKYNGFEEQSELDWNVYDYQARYYDPALGRFLNVDPAADLMRRHSTYSYAFNNPLRFIDPDGMMPEEINNCCGGSPQSMFNQLLGNLESAIMPVVDAVVEVVDDVIDAVTPEKIEVTEVKTTKSFEDGNDRNVYEDPNAPAGKDNAPNSDGSAKVIVEPDVILEVDEGMNQLNGGSGILDLIFEKVTPTRKPTGDSTIVKDYYYPHNGLVVPEYEGGGQGWGISGRDATEKDSLKYGFK